MKKLLITAIATATIAMGGAAHANPADCTPVGQEPRASYPPCATIPPEVQPPTTPPLIPETGSDPSSALYIGGTLAALGGAFVIVARTRRRRPDTQPV